MNLTKLAAPVMAIAIGFAASAAIAEETKGPFIGILGGLNIADDADINGTGIATDADLDSGLVAIPTIGYRYGNGFRTEFEGAYRESDVDSLSGVVGGTGDVESKSLMANLVYEVNTNTRFKPYFGGGLGIARVDYDGIAPVGGGTINDEDEVFAYQGIAGISYWLSEALEIAAEYRYFATEDPDFTTSTGVGVEGEYDSHGVLFGLRWNFGAPRKAMAPAAPMPVAQPAPVRPAPAPAPKVAAPAPMPKTFIVFFDWDKSNLTAEATGIVAAAAAYAKQHGAAIIEATGHADRSGPATYNMGLSARRADSVRAKLIELGIAATEIAVAAKGETDPLVPTEDGVREPQNRRVEIILK